MRNVSRVTFLLYVDFLRYPRSEPDSMTRLVPRARSNLYTVAARDSCTSPACGGQGLRRTGPFWVAAFRAKQRFGSSTWIRQD